MAKLRKQRKEKLQHNVNILFISLIFYLREKKMSKTKKQRQTNNDKSKKIAI